MPDESVAQAGSRFARDMKRIREDRDISRADIHEETMISVELIRSFEERGLVDHPSFNRVYLRSFVRSLAQCTGIDSDFVVQELERALEGRYTNQLAVEYLGEAPAEKSRSGEAEASTSEGEATQSTASEAPAEESKEASEATTRSRRSSRRQRGSDPVQTAIWVVLGLILVAGLIWIGWSMWGGAQSESTPEQMPAADTTAQAAPSVDTTATPPADPRPVLGDTLYVTVIATDARVDPIRIRRDTDLRRPYYIEQGQAAVFPAQDSIILERELEQITVLLNGYFYPVDPQAETGQIRITRASAQAFLDTARLTQGSVPADPDTFSVLGP